jgi:hypothetical protein
MYCRVIFLGYRKSRNQYAHPIPSHKVKAVDMLDNTINGDLSKKQNENLGFGGSH